jgi:GTP-binding protein YchF
MQIGLIGFSGAGVKTVFSAITGLTPAAGIGSTIIGTSRLAVLQVPDPRLELISSVYNPKRSTHSKVEIAEFPGVFGARPDPRLLAKCRESDALALVIGAFGDGGLDKVPEPDLESLSDTLRDEMILADLTVAESRLTRLTVSLKKRKNEIEEAELKVLVECLKQLEMGRVLLDLNLDAEDKRRIRGFGFLSLKPVFLLINIGEGDVGKEQEITERFLEKGLTARTLCGDLESELATIEGDDRGELMDDLGIEELAAPKVLRAVYECMDVCTFYTYGEDECRAWTLRAGQTAVDAAARIHTDLARGFIRAEVVSFADFQEHECIKNVKGAGRFRLEGKDYTVQDGDLIIIRHSS